MNHLMSTPLQQNGVAKRKNGHLLIVTRAFFFQTNVPKNYWKEAILTTTNITNRLSSQELGIKSPMQVLSTFYPNFNNSNELVPKIFGCVAFVHIYSQDKSKLDPRAVRRVFVGYFST